MNYKETLFFVGQSLTINHDAKNKVLIEEQLKSKSVDWETVVKVSTAHYVLPALYCNFHKAKFLKYLPQDLVEFMKSITDLNRERNEKLLAQVKELNIYLLGHQIKAIFLKGVSNLIANLYDDIGERMLGDIDFIVSKKDYEKTIHLLKEFGYSPIEYNVPKFHRHYPSMIKNNNIGAIEVHKELLREKFSPKFNYSHIEHNLIKIKNFYLIAYPKQLHYNLLVHQINDFGFIYNLISLRKAYDVYLLSKKVNMKNYLDELNQFKNPINSFIAIQNQLFNTTIPNKTNKKIQKYVNIYYWLLNNRVFCEKFQKRKKLKIAWNYRINILIKSFYKKDYRVFLKKEIKRKYLNKNS
ncbi:nucleotidyltransferase family protein [Polaribacter sp. Hel1_33_49]|uniref:nucleotidyltransferase family protein n=1 Tax=Polaribacter sp. Hel1_33_49 TaxID=1336803 RepID=UPI00052DBD0A|nr:nucleotidyltransferase family protein [Polaribacter sp. Hel1_33_49]KGL60307.1 hypothetical protein PHEL49_1187 [Polaribacter sp. Hel1_33_49]